MVNTDDKTSSEGKKEIIYNNNINNEQNTQNTTKITYSDWLQLQKYAIQTIQTYVKYQQLWQESIKNIPSLPLQERINYFLGKHNNQVVRAFLKNYLIEYQQQKIIIPKIKGRRTRRIQYLKPEQIQTLLNALNKQPKKQALILLTFETGLRISEVLNIKFEDIDWTNNSITGIGKGNKTFKVYFSNLTRKLLLTSLTTTTGKIFNEYHGPNARISCTLWFSKLTKKVLGKKYHFHSIRHGTATYLLSKGERLEEIRDYLRHASIKTTEIYAHTKKQENVKKLFKKNFSTEKIE